MKVTGLKMHRFGGKRLHSSLTQPVGGGGWTRNQGHRKQDLPRPGPQPNIFNYYTRVRIYTHSHAPGWREPKNEDISKSRRCGESWGWRVESACVCLCL